MTKQNKRKKQRRKYSIMEKSGSFIIVCFILFSCVFTSVTFCSRDLETWENGRSSGSNAVVSNPSALTPINPIVGKEPNNLSSGVEGHATTVGGRGDQPNHNGGRDLKSRLTSYVKRQPVPNSRNQARPAQFTLTPNDGLGPYVVGKALRDPSDEFNRSDRGIEK